MSLLFFTNLYSNYKNNILGGILNDNRNEIRCKTRGNSDY